MFQMQRNNEEIQQAMLAVQEENALLREYLAVLGGGEALLNSSKHPMHNLPDKLAKGNRVSRKTIAVQPPCRQIKLNTRKTVGASSTPLTSSSG